MKGILAFAWLACAPLIAAAQTAPTSAPPAADGFDGTWDATVACPDVVDGARKTRGYLYEFPVTVSNGALHGEHGARNAPGWLALDGRIQPDGSADLNAQGLTGDPDFAIGQPRRSTPYAYRIVAQFAGSHGTGQRVDARPCDLSFGRR
ncbi:MAG TPA: hypothetical protein VMN79_12100 [Casimicrobiaceae bacterium]|nr:hypothetical protein [Casimicrobiaceae bacterium]